MPARFLLSPEAETQVGDIVEFIATDNEAAAIRVRDAIYAACQLLAEHPDIGHTREDLTDRPVKFWSVFSYLVVYNPTSFPLEIISVTHAARDVNALLRNAE